MSESIKSVSKRKKSCVNCGAELTYEPGTDLITCDYCGHKEQIEHKEQPFQEIELLPYLEQLGSQSHSTELSLLDCKSCGATQHVEESYKTLQCVYCASPLQIDELYREEWIQPGALIPFQINQGKAHLIFKNWVNKLWWAPNNLKKASLSPENTKGLYLPYWTFDAQLQAGYTGMRGDYYYVTKTVGSGENKRQVRERRTDWSPAAGNVAGFIDDTLVKATKKQQSQIPEQVARWDLKQLTNFDSRFLAGYVTEKYTISLKEGHIVSNRRAEEICRNWIRRDIGGDTQKISSVNMSLDDETFKHILLPVYISSYYYNSKQYHFYVNGQTGKIHGSRPYSFWKIFFAVVCALIVLTVIIVVSSQVQ
ncbi:DNA helicase PriA [Nonlabens tegetincola]|uniref:DNA helicase PriA n=1 Tax=Nonlabens tegetincola TaxID=323273 RepID=UPI000A208841|nr:DNA helicase PriA [Nonlabens tegetincola]ARN72079.1 DNA helicase PriA [Nonlabens tegetincola]